MARIAILTHKNDTFAQIPYFLREISRVWQEQGIEVIVPRALSPGSSFDADLAIMHVDRTVIPAEYLAWGRQFTRCLNLYTADITKRVISEHLVGSKSAHEGPVLVKSNLNCGGLKEREDTARMLRTAVAPDHEYVIYPSVGAVPTEVWTDSQWVVEKFLPEVIDGQYCLRTWVFLGDGETNSLSFSDQPIIKSANVKNRVPIDDKIPEVLRAKREELGFDFGKFDYVIHNGEVVLFDVNRTPSVGAFSPEQFMPRVRKYADGVWSYLSGKHG